MRCFSLLTLRVFTIGVAALLLASCAHYHLGTGTKQKFATLFIAPVTSEAQVPEAKALVTTQLREAVLHDGRITLVNSAAEADAVLQVTLASYSRLSTVSQTADTGLTRRYDVTLQAQATLTDNRTHQPLFTKRPLTATRGVFTDSGLVPAEYQTLPLLAEQLADQAVHEMLDTW